MIRLLHSADWHIGQTLMGWSREAEHALALDRVVATAEARAVDAVIVAGDVFDTQNPSARAEATFFRTLVELRRRLPRLTVIVVAGNHDPAGRLEAPRPLLAELGVHVIGTVARPGGAIDLDRHLIAIDGADGSRAHVLALPYLAPASLPPIDRRDERPGSPVVRAVRAFHDEAIAAARARIGAGPLIVTGHLAVGGGLESEGAERRILIGGEHAVPSDLYPADLAYVALGHLHRPQAVGRETVRYSGSLMPLSATERDYRHGVSVVEIAAAGTTVEHVPIARPVAFLRLPERGALRLDEVDAALAACGFDAAVAPELRPFVQLVLSVDGPMPGLEADLDRITAAHPIRFVGHTIRRSTSGGVGETTDPAEDLPDLADRDPEELFRRAFEAAHHAAPTAAHLDAFALVREEA